MTRINLKKSLLATALLTGMAFTGAATINDGQEKNVVSTHQTQSRDDRPEDKVLIWSPWSAGGVQDKAIRKVVDVYNGTNAVRDGKSMEVQVHTFDGGYSGITTQFQNDLRVGGTALNELPDIYIDYNDSTASLISFGEQYQGRSFATNINDIVPGIEEQLVPSLAAQSDQITGGEEGAIYGIPFATSSELMGIDAPLVIWLLQQWIVNGGQIQIDGEVPVLNEIVDAADSYKDGALTTLNGDDYSSAGDSIYSVYSQDGKQTEVTQEIIENVQLTASDKSGIEKFWENTGSDVSGQTITIDENTFTSGKGLLKLSKELLKVADDTQGSKLSENTGQALMGYDAPNNNFYTYGQGLTGSLENPENGLLYKDGDKVIYNMLERGSDQWNDAANILDFFADGFKSGAIWTPNAGVSYGSDLIKNHQLPFSIGSTAGASYYVDTKDASKVNGGDIVYTQAPGRLEEDGTHNVQMQQGPNLGVVANNNVSEAKTQGISDFINFLISPEKFEFGGAIEEVTDYLKPDNFNTYKETAYESGDSDTTPTFSGVTADWLKADYIETVDGKTHFTEAAKSDANVKTYKDKYDNTYSYFDFATATIPEGNVKASKYAFADSYFGVEVFRKDDSNQEPKYGAKFVIDTKDGNSDMKTPAVYMSSSSNYIVGTNAVFEDKDYAKVIEDDHIQANGKWEGTEFKNNWGSTPEATDSFANKYIVGPSFAYKNIKETLANSPESKEVPKVELELEPYSTTTSQYRQEINGEIKKMKNSAVNTGKVDSSEDILIDLHNTAVKAGWFEGKAIMVWEWWMYLLIALAAATVIGGIAVLIWWLVSRNKKSKSTI